MRCENDGRQVPYCYQGDWPVLHEGTAVVLLSQWHRCPDAEISHHALSADCPTHLCAALNRGGHGHAVVCWISEPVAGLTRVKSRAGEVKST